MRTTVWVYAKNEDEAERNARGVDGYGVWESEASLYSAYDNPHMRLTDEKPFRVTTTITRLPAKRQLRKLQEKRA